MKNLPIITLLCCFIMSCNSRNPNDLNENLPQGPITLVIHGGAGTIKRENLTPEKEKAYHDAMGAALDSGYAILDKGGSSLDAIISAIRILEDNPLFNAGKGSVFTHEGKNELDASIMDGSNLKAGAVAGVTTIRNPITAAYAVMTKSQHVMLTGRGAEKFAEEQELEMVDPSYFFDSIRYEQWKRVQENERKGATSMTESFKDPYTGDVKFGTVGAVALDQYGNLAAGTSTGGMTNKKWGRVGDSPIIGAGTYANNKTCAVSSTGYGEYFIRLAVAHDISAMMEYGSFPLQAAADSVIMKKLPALGGDGGVVALDRQGNIAMPFSSAGMYRGFKKNGERKTFIFKD